MTEYFDPHNAHWFYLEIDGLFSGRFQEVSGLGCANEVVEIKEGGRNDHSIKFKNRTTYNDITLKRGFWNNPEMFGWFEEAALNTWTPRKNGSIVMTNGLYYGDELGRWNFFRAFPIKWDGLTWNAMSTAALCESMTLAVEWISMELL